MKKLFHTDLKYSDSLVQHIPAECILRVSRLIPGTVCLKRSCCALYLTSTVFLPVAFIGVRLAFY
jgi:hypothetical protein